SSRRNRSASNWRPLCQVVITSDSPAPSSKGNQPPWLTFSRFAAKNEPSINKKLQVTSQARGALQPHERATLYASNVVMSMERMTAMPYADARLLEERKLSTRPIVTSMSIQLIKGT